MDDKKRFLVFRKDKESAINIGKLLQNLPYSFENEAVVSSSLGQF
jgi:hypothetical protein